MLLCWGEGFIISKRGGRAKGGADEVLPCWGEGFIISVHAL